MKTQITTFFTFLIVGISFFIIFPQKPEFFNITSDDTVLRISGVSSSGTSPYIEKIESNNLLLTPHYYSLQPYNFTLFEPMNIEANIEPGYSVYVFDRDIIAWRSITEQGLKTWPYFTSIGIAPSLDMNLPNFIEEELQLLSLAPIEAVGFTSYYIFGFENDDSRFIVPNSFKQGGCDGIFRPGSSIKSSSKFRTVQLPIAGVMQKVDLELRYDWQIDNSQKRACRLSESQHNNVIQ
jgi:hypothetical protein